MEETGMTKEEIQRFINLGIKNNKTELEIFRELREVLGVKYEPDEVKQEK